MIVTLLLAALACDPPASDGQRHTDPEVNTTLYQTPADPDFSQAMEFTLKEAVAAYGSPPHRIRARLDDLMGEFYTGLEAAFTDEQKLGGDVRIEELTWEKDTANLITIWYHDLPTSTKPVDFLVYPKDADF